MIQFDEHIIQMGWNHQLVKHAEIGAVEEMFDVFL